MGKKQSLLANGSRALSTGKTLAISLIKTVGLVSIATVVAFWSGLFTVQELTDMVNNGINLPTAAFVAYGLVALALVSYKRTRAFIGNATEKEVGSKKWWNIGHAVFIVAMLATSGWLLGNNLGAWAIGAALLWALYYTGQSWKSSKTSPQEASALSREELDGLFSDEPPVRRLQAAV